MNWTLNSAVNVVIENNVELTPTLAAEHATADVMRQMVEIAPDCRPELRGQFEANRARIEAMVFEVLQEHMRKLANRVRERTIKGKDY